MKKLGILLISILMSVSAYADGIQYFDYVRFLYEQGRYEEAIQGFTACKKLYYDELDVASIDNWIGKCNIKIKERNAAIQARRQAEIADAKRRADESRLAEERKAYEARQQERKERELLYVSSNAFIFDKEYTGMHQAIKGYIAENSEQRFTDNSEMAYWCVYITANAYEYSHINEVFNSNVVAYIKVVNAITNDVIYEGETYIRKGSSRGYEYAAQLAYSISNKDNIVKRVGTKILEQLK